MDKMIIANMLIYIGYRYVLQIFIRYHHKYLIPSGAGLIELRDQHDVHQITGNVKKRIDQIHGSQ